MNLVSKQFVENCSCKKIPISEIFSYENQTIPEMKKIMTFNLGLAGPQVGINRTFFIFRYGNEILSVYNPEWEPETEKRAASKESCLTYGTRRTTCVMRYKTIIAEFTNGEGVPVRMKLRGRDAIVFQHESDHLKGKTIFFDPEKGGKK